MIVIGWDPGLATLGFGVVDFQPTSTRVLEHGDIGEPGADDETGVRLNRICKNVDYLFNKWTPDVMGLEAQLGVHIGKDRDGQHAHANLKLVHTVSGILRMAGCCALAEPIPIYEPQPVTVKIAVLGKGAGHAEKSQVREGVRRLFGARCTSHDADAIATAVAALRLHRKAEAASRARDSRLAARAIG